MSAPDRTNGHGSHPDGAPRRGYDGPIAPPQNLEAEQSVLGAVLLSDTALPALVIDERLQPDDFYREGHARIYQAMLDLHTVGEPVDALTLVEHLKQAGDLEAVGGRAAIDLLAGSVPAVGNVRQYARIVRDNAMLRRLLRASYEIQARVHSHEALPRELVDMAERAILEVAQEDSRKDFRPINDLLKSELDKLERLSREGKAITGTASGFDDLDVITGGFQPGNLIVLAARPSMGKCLAGGALVYDPRTGARRRIDELVAAIEGGEDAIVAAVGPDLKLRPARVSAALRSGRRPVFRLTTRLGRTITATANHPLLTFDGWQELQDLAPGSRIAVPSRLPHMGGAPPILDVFARPRLERVPAHPDWHAHPTGVATVTRSRPVRELAASDLWWDEVAAIEPAGEAETYDLTVPGDHNFVADDIVVHNSALMANFAENAALESQEGRRAVLARDVRVRARAAVHRLAGVDPRRRPAQGQGAAVALAEDPPGLEPARHLAALHRRLVRPLGARRPRQGPPARPAERRRPRPDPHRLSPADARAGRGSRTAWSRSARSRAASRRSPASSTCR